MALDAIEGLRRQWAVELGQQDIRVVTLKTGGIPETLPPTERRRDEIIAGIQEATLLKRSATLAGVGNVAAFVAYRDNLTALVTERFQLFTTP